jgi:hypothetical protein
VRLELLLRPPSPAITFGLIGYVFSSPCLSVLLFIFLSFYLSSSLLPVFIFQPLEPLLHHGTVP